MRFARRTAEVPLTPVGSDDELDALLRVARLAASGDDLDAVLEEALERAIQLVGADEGSIQLLDRVTMTLAVSASRGLGDAARAQRVAIGQGISGRVAATGEPLLLRSAVDVDRFVGHVAKDRPIFASMCVPLRAREGVIGVLNLNGTRPGGYFTEHHLRIAGLFAETAAQAIASTRLVADARRHALQLELLSGAMVRLGGSLDVTALASQALQDAMILAASDAAFVCVAPDPFRPPTVIRFAGLSRDAMKKVVGGPAFRSFDTPSGPRVIADVPADPGFAALGPDLKGRALALVPLRGADGRAHGLLGVAVPARADEQLSGVLWTYATQAGLALSNAGLHEEVSGSEEALDTIVSALHLPIILLDEELRFRAINPAAAAELKLSPEFELGRHAHGKLPPEIEELALASHDVNAEVVVRSGGGDRTVQVTAATVADGARAGARIVVITDVTAHRDLEQRQADFVAVIGHELRTPLTSIKGFAWTLHKRGEAVPPQARAAAIASIVAQTERLERLIEDLLYVSGIERGRPSLALSWENVRDLCVGMVAEASRISPDRVIRFDHPGDDVVIYTDRVKVEQIVWHLLDNAMKFSDEDSLITVSLSVDEHTVSIAVRDEGIGLYSGDVERIFEPFVQVDGSATRKHGGTGMGLYVVATLAEALGAQVDVESALGRGSTFTISLPKTAVDPNAPQEA